MQKHKFNIFPEMLDEDYQRLKADLQANGYDAKLPIMTYQGAIIDGWNRFKACEELRIMPAIKQFQGNDAEAIEYIMRTNKRRNLTSSQWACIATEAEEMLAAIAEAVEAERRKKQAETQSETKKEGLSDNKLTHSPRPEKQPERVTQKAAEIFNTNRTYISEAQKLKEEKPEVFEQVKRGEKTITEVKKEAKVEKRKADIQAQKEAIESGKIQMPVGVFEVISLDPPWNYGREYDPDGSRVANPYPEMTQAQLLELKPPFAEDSVCFLWTTHAFIWQAKELLDKWGFTYKATMVWDKEKIGMGAWLRMQCEFCLVGIKGKPAWNNTSWRDIIREPRREHSRKPETFYRMVEEITIGRRLEYFSREQRKGWEVFGNDTEKF
jgi:N6-adenosine-specific RNA methylase IME4